MKRINLSVCHILLAVIIIPSTVAALGFEVTAGAWYQSPKGQLAFKPDDAGDILDIENDLKYDDETQFLGRLIIDMPLLVPNTEQAIEIRSDMTDQNVNCSVIASCNS